MKAFLFALATFVSPLLLMAQSDWCTCMETESKYESIATFVSQSNSQTLLISSANSQSTAFITDNKQALPAALPLSPKAKTTPEVLESPAKRTNVSPAKQSMRTAAKKRKKLFQTRVKRRKKARRYRGKCPAF